MQVAACLFIYFFYLYSRKYCTGWVAVDEYLVQGCLILVLGLEAQGSAKFTSS